MWKVKIFNFFEYNKAKNIEIYEEIIIFPQLIILNFHLKNDWTHIQIGFIYFGKTIFVWIQNDCRKKNRIYLKRKQTSWIISKREWGKINHEKKQNRQIIRKLSKNRDGELLTSIIGQLIEPNANVKMITFYNN